MNHTIAVAILLLAVAASGFAAENKTVTFFSDGALVEVEAAAAKGVAEISLPGGVLAESLRISPLGSAVIQNVEVSPVRQDGKNAKEMEQLLEQKHRLQDRLQALETREDIFKAAAKSQSGKAPRKTKTNPDPLQSIRQGTEFAIAQLEAVYTARRRAEQEMRRIDARIGAMKKAGQAGVTVARVVLMPKSGRVRVRYALGGEGWTPRYDMRLDNSGTARLALYGRLPSGFGGYLLQASPASLAESTGAPTVPVAAGSLARLAEYRLPVQEASFGSGARAVYSVVVTNSSQVHLPAGDASFYRNGEYWGQFRFEGISSARSKKMGNQ